MIKKNRRQCKHPIALSEFKKAHRRIAPFIHTSPLSRSRTLSRLAAASSKHLKKTLNIYLKMENQQITGSFKIRGALNKVLSLSSKDQKKPLISCSAGNHAQGLAYAARSLGAKSIAVLPLHTPWVKEAAVRAYGAAVVKKGVVYDESYRHALKICQQRKGVLIHPYEDPLVIAGQGSIGLEILTALPEVDSIIAPVGGGGLISGIAGAVKQIKPQCRVYGVVSKSSPGMERLFHKLPYKPKTHFKGAGLADGICVKQPSSFMLKNYIQPFVDDIISVAEDDIIKAMFFLLERSKTLVEGAGAVGAAALLSPSHRLALGRNCAVVLSGGNIDLHSLHKILKNFKNKQFL